MLVKQEPAVSTHPPTWDIAEFFIVRAYRKRGIGTQVAHVVWRRFPGPWTVRVLKLNHAALPFWERAITAFTGEAVEPSSIQRHGQPVILFSFVSPPR